MKGLICLFFHIVFWLYILWLLLQPEEATFIKVVLVLTVMSYIAGMMNVKSIKEHHQALNLTIAESNARINRFSQKQLLTGFIIVVLCVLLKNVLKNVGADVVESLIYPLVLLLLGLLLGFIAPQSILSIDWSSRMDIVMRKPGRIGKPLRGLPKRDRR